MTQADPQVHVGLDLQQGTVVLHQGGTDYAPVRRSRWSRFSPTARSGAFLEDGYASPVDSYG
ncbi:hypothetical protein [Streptomyces goshikiensis]|uniref:hypothetical protein n=1 Tax=Streptomyces goshikiensis TaxID=1942 RepID=UPI0036A26A61